MEDQRRETQAASDPTNHVAIGLVLLQCEHGGKAFVKKTIACLPVPLDVAKTRGAI